jgi:hypothetical protein
MNDKLKGYGRKWLWSNLEFTGGSEENHERSQVRIGGVMVEI